MAAPSDPAARIITHMNNDHQDSLVRYLEHFSGLSSFAARNAQLHEMTLSHLVLRTSPISKNDARAPKTDRYTIPLDPPLTSWAQARERLVAMDAETIRALKRSDITVKTWAYPQGVEAIATMSLGLLFLVCFRRENLLPGSPDAWYPWSLLGEQYPGVAQKLYDYWPRVFVPVVVVHFAEAAYLHFSRLRKHSVPTFSGLWFKYILTHLVEGFTSFGRFDKFVKAKKAEKEKAKH